MRWVRDPRPGLSWRALRLRRKIRKLVTQQARRLPPAFGGAHELSRTNRFRVAWGRYWYDRPIDERLVVYEAFHGNGALDSPRAIFDELLDAPDMGHLKHVWCFKSLAVKRAFDGRFARHPRVRSVLTESLDYYKVLSTAKYLVNNQTFPANFTKRAGQLYVNTAHGTPLKTMGYEIHEGVFGVRNPVRNLLAADYLVSASGYMTEALYARAYRLRGIYQGTIIEEGYPRVDAQFLDESGRQRVREQLRTAGVELPTAGTTLVLFAPTWRGTQYTNPVYDAEALQAEVQALAESLGDGYTVLLKVHQQIFTPVARHEALAGRLVPNWMPTNRLLGIVDVLVTDYSSIFFDFLATGRPVVFYVPDAASYERYRGMLFELAELPGPVYAELDQLAKGIAATGTGTADDALVSHGQRYREAAAAYCPHEDGHVTARVIDIVFRGRTEGYRLHRGLPDERTSILICMGRSRTSGVNTAMLSLLGTLDPERYDVTVLLNQPANGGERALQELVPDSLRTLVRIGTFPVTTKRLRTHNQFLQTGLGPDGDFPGDEARVLNAEWRHSLGESRFDHVVEFSGYSAFWPAVLLHGPAGTRSIWLHNDMAAELDRGADDQRFRHKGLPAVLTLYPRFDNLVSVSPTLARINAESLAHLAPPEKFRYAHNTIDTHRITTLASRSDTPGDLAAPDIRTDGVPLSAAAAQLVQAFPPEEISSEVERQVLLARMAPERDDTTTFITAGRLAPEKNHARMIRAFAAVHAEHPHTRLLILGDGPALADLESLTDQLDIAHAVRLAGYQPNPYLVMGEADCFVLSSDYEGQPMVILEALALGLPVVTVEFGSAADAIPGGGGLVVPQTDHALADGMRAFLRGEVTTANFDPVQYNTAAINEFTTAIKQASPPLESANSYSSFQNGSAC